MKTKATQFLSLILPLLLAVTMVVSVVGNVSAASYPTISIVSVVKDDTVTIKGYNFPLNQKFTVRMGEYGTYAKGGIVVGTKKLTDKHTFTATFDIPDEFKGDARIAIRLDSKQGYYAFNWFWNNPEEPKPGYKGYPTFSIAHVEQDDSVTVVTNNLPPDEKFTVRMGKYGTLGIGGIVVDTLESGAGGTLTPKFMIPDELKGLERIAIRMDSSTGYYYAFNWFWNNTTTGTVPPEEPVYVGIPTFSIQAVVRDTSVTIKGKNFPADKTFTVRMGEYGTLGIGGIKVDTFESGEGGDFTATFDVPAELAGRYRIAIRLETADGYFYAYNWFFNNTTD